MNYGGCAIVSSNYFDCPDFTVGNIVCDQNPLENSTMNVAATINTSLAKKGFESVPCDLYVGGTKVSTAYANLSSATSTTVTFSGVNVGAYGEKTIEVVVNPNDSPKENNSDNNRMAYGIFVRQPNFTVSLSASNANPYEKQTITVTASINLNLYGSKTPFSARVGATLSYNGKEYALKSGATQYANLSNSAASAAISWQVDVGTYGAANSASDNCAKAFTVTIVPDSFSVASSERNGNDNTATMGITLKRDFAITYTGIDRGNVFENEAVHLTFKVKNNNPYRAYSNVPISVVFKDALGKTTTVASKNINISAGGEMSFSVNVNVGNVTANADQNDTIYATVNHSYPSTNSWKAYHEANTGNNLGSVGVKVKRDIKLNIKLVDPNAGFSANSTCITDPAKMNSTQAITSCLVYNDSRFSLYGSNQMRDVLTVVFTVNGKSQSKTVVVPAKGNNLVYFKWDIPEAASANISVSLKWTVNGGTAGEEREANPGANNTATFSKNIVTIGKYNTPDTNLIKNSGASANYFSSADYAKKKPYVARWACWICSSSGEFTAVQYALSTESQMALTPMESAEYASNDGKTIASGSAFSALFSYKLVTECSNRNYGVGAGDYTYAQNVVAMFPEFQYAAINDCKTMYTLGNQLNACKFQFAANDRADEKQRVHFTPVNMPDAQYKVGVLGYDLWTPAGMIYVNGSGSFMIGGSVYDDHYVN